MRRLVPTLALAALASITVVTAHELTTGRAPGVGPDGETSPEVGLERRRYAVSGATARQLRRPLRAKGRRMDGETAFAWADRSVDVGYELGRSGDSCRVTRPGGDDSAIATPLRGES